MRFNLLILYKIFQIILLSTSLVFDKTVYIEMFLALNSIEIVQGIQFQLEGRLGNLNAHNYVLKTHFILNQKVQSFATWYVVYRTSLIQKLFVLYSVKTCPSMCVLGAEGSYSYLHID